MLLKPVTFHGDSLDRLRDFPTDARQQAGQELYRVQIGREPSDWKPMQAIGVGVREIRLRDASGAFRWSTLRHLPTLSMSCMRSRRSRRRRLSAIWTLLLRACET
jgi:phage-related protein